MADGHPTAGRHGGWPPDRRLDGGRPLRPPVGMTVGRPVDDRADGLADPSTWAVLQGPSPRGRPPLAVRLAETLEPHNY
jgi:hypothetical protein